MNKDTKTALIIGGVIVAILIIVPLIFGLVGGWQGYGYGMMGPWMMGGFGGMWFMPILMILFWGLVIWGIVWLVRGAGGCCGVAHSDHAEHHDSAMDILKSRYARGEINKQEFEDKKRDLV